MMNMFLPRSTASVRLLYLCIALSSVPVLLSHIHDDVVMFRHCIFLNNFPSFNHILLYIYNQILLLDQEQLKQICLKTINNTLKGVGKHCSFPTPFILIHLYIILYYNYKLLIFFRSFSFFYAFMAFFFFFLYFFLLMNFFNLVC